MKTADFKNLLQGVREAGAYLRGNKRTATLIDRIGPESVTVRIKNILIFNRVLRVRQISGVGAQLARSTGSGP